MSANQADQSGPIIRREEQTPSDPPSHPRSWFILYAAGGLFLALGMFFFLRDTFSPDTVVRVTSASYMWSERSGAAPKLVVDTGAMLVVGGRTVVYRLSGLRVVEAPVEVGERFAGVVEIRRGLTAGDTVVLTPPVRLSPGMKVRVKD